MARCAARRLTASPLEEAVAALQRAANRRHDAMPGSTSHADATAEEERLARLVWTIAKSEDGQADPSG